MAARHTMFAGMLLAAAAGADARQPHPYVNVTAGGPLRAGVYGRIEVRDAPPPPLFSPRPLVASKALGLPPQEPLYLYLPAGQVRKWPLHCQRWHACERPVYFVRLDDAPGKLGSWKQRGRARRAEAAPLAADADAPF